LKEVFVTKTKQLPTRQRTRKAVLLLSLLLFPITLYYFSPALIIQGASEGIINGSFIVFTLMFLSALFLGRLWCSWACPWIGLIAFMAIQAGGYRAVDPLFQLDGGLTVLQLEPPWFIIYYIVVALFLGLAVVFGRRAGCHTICWMAPFMILGRKIRNLFRWPALRLEANEEACIDCSRCTRECPMSLDVNAMVHADTMENSECILCGTCVDTCPQNVIRYSFNAGK
jgi:ferredoxin-type protein NapH